MSNTSTFRANMEDWIWVDYDDTFSPTPWVVLSFGNKLFAHPTREIAEQHCGVLLDRLSQTLVEWCDDHELVKSLHSAEEQ